MENQMEEESFSRNCYYVCMAVAAYAMAGYCVMQLLHVDPACLFPSCRLYEQTGYYCMGCGGTRALREFFQGHFVRSFFYHPAVDMGMGFLAVFLPSWTLHILTKGQVRGVIVKPVYFYILAGIVVVQWGIKNGIYYFVGRHVI